MSMELDHEFTVPVPVEEAWRVLLDIERVAPCMPGATLDSVDGDEFTGRIKVKVGAITVTYKGNARFTGRDDQAHTVTIEGSGTEARGSGTASAKVFASLHEAGEQTRVAVHTTLNVTGRPAQFGRGVLADVGARIIDRFAACLAEQLSGAPSAAAAPETPREATVPPPREAAEEQVTPLRPVQPPREEAIDLLEVAGVPVLKRVAPVLAGLVVVFLFWRLLRWRRRRRAR